MTDVYSTETDYLEQCKRHKCSPNEFIEKIFDYEKKQQEKQPFRSFDQSALKLCGDNHLFTTRRLTDQDVEILCATLKSNTYVTSLDLRYNLITDEGAKLIAELLETNVTLRELNLMCNDFGENGAKFIAEALAKNCTLQTLKLTGNKIGRWGGLYIAKALQTNRSLEYLDVGECDLKIDSVIAFSTVLWENDALKGINLNRPLLWTQQEETTVHMKEMLKMNRTLTEIHLAKYEMRDFGAARLCEALPENQSLQVLDLSANRITRDGAKLFANVLKLNTPLQVLDLAYNRIQDSGAAAIADVLTAMNVNLRVLVITYNEINGDGLCAIANALTYNSTLYKVYIWGNNLEESACNAFARLLQSQRLTEDDTDVRPYEVDGRTYLCHVPHDCDYRRFRFAAPVYGDDVPKDRSYALF